MRVKGQEETGEWGVRGTMLQNRSTDDDRSHNYYYILSILSDSYLLGILHLLVHFSSKSCQGGYDYPHFKI